MGQSRDCISLQLGKRFARRKQKRVYQDEAARSWLRNTSAAANNLQQMSHNAGAKFFWLTFQRKDKGNNATENLDECFFHMCEIYKDFPRSKFILKVSPQGCRKKEQARKFRHHSLFQH